MLKNFFKMLFVFGIMLISIFGNAAMGFSLNDLQKIHEDEIGRWQEVPFGKIRLISCSNGVKDLSVVVGGIQVQLDSGWYLKKPILRPLSEQLPFWTEAPLFQKDGFYTGEVFFPVIYGRDVRDTTDFNFGVQGNFPVCQKDKCMDMPIRLVLSLPVQKGNYTSMCTYILQKQKSVPLPAKMVGVDGYVWKIGEDETQLFVTGIKDVDIALLFPLNTDVKVLETQLELNTVSMRLKMPVQKIPNELVLLTNKGIFKIPIKVVEAPINYSYSEFVPINFWFWGWELFFLSPLFIWWGIGVAKNGKIWKKEIIKLGLFFPLIFVLKMGLCYFFKDIFISSAYLFFSMVLLGTVCIFPPRRWYIALGLFLIWPLLPQIPKMSVGTFGIWALIVLLEVAVPFVFLYLKTSEVGKILREMKKKKFFLFNLFFLLPTVIILIFTLKQGGQPPISYSNELNPSGLTIVCQSKECIKWQKLPNVYFIDSETVLGQSLQKIYRRERQALIIWQDKKGRIIFSPKISIRRISKFIDGWQKYHASDKP